MKRNTALRIALAVAALAVAFLLGTLTGGQDAATTGSSGAPRSRRSASTNQPNRAR